MIEIRTTSIVVKRTRSVPMVEASSPARELKPVPSPLPLPAQPLRKWSMPAARCARPMVYAHCVGSASRIVALSGLGSFAISTPTANGQAPVSAVVSQPIGLRGHDEVVPVEAAELVGPAGHRDQPPLGDEGG